MNATSRWLTLDILGRDEADESKEIFLDLVSRTDLRDVHTVDI